jgi:hypothetical protein
MAAGACGDKRLYAAAPEAVEQLIHYGGKIVHPSQVMGGFGTATQDNAKVRNPLPKCRDGVQQSMRVGAGQRTTRKEHGVASRWELKQVKEAGAAKAFIGEQLPIRADGNGALLHEITAHVPYQPAGVEFFRAHCCTEPAEAAPKWRHGIKCPLGERFGKFKRECMTLKKQAIAPAGAALRAVGEDIVKGGGEFFFHVTRRLIVVFGSRRRWLCAGTHNCLNFGG